VGQPRPVFDPARPDDNDPLRIQPRRPYEPEPMPDFEDPYDLNRPLPHLPRGNAPFSIGSDDLNPHPNPYNIIDTDGSGLGPMGLPRPQPGQGGMYMDIRGRGRGQRPPGVPPGARWDPIGPGNGRGGSGGSNPFGGFGSGDFI